MDEYWQKWNPVMQQWVSSNGPGMDRRGYYRKMVEQPDGEYKPDVIVTPLSPVRTWTI
jgi:hypothetical protein